VVIVKIKILRHQHSLAAQNPEESKEPYFQGQFRSF